MEEEIKKTFATPEGCDLLVENVKGQVAVEGWDRPETEVTAVRHQDWAEVEISQDGNKVIARTKGERGLGHWLNWFNWGRTPHVDYTVRVPHTSELTLKNVSGPTNVKQIKGQVHVNSVDGPAVLETVTGEVRTETVNGDLQARHLEGKAKLKTVNGKLNVESSVLHDLSAETVNGDIKVAATLDSEGRYTFHTVNGSCHLIVPPDLRARVSAHGVNVSVKCAQPAQSAERHFGSWQGVIGEDDGPKAEITFRTVNGRLRIDNSGMAGEPAAEFVAKADAGSEPLEPPEPPEPPAPPATPVEVKAAEPPAAEKPKSQLEILQMVERGEISVEEAVKLMGGQSQE